jgi:hypothetical protein
VNESPLHERLRAAVGSRSFRHVAEMTDTNHESVRRYLSGHSPSVEFLGSLCKALNLNSDWLLFGRGPMKLEDVRSSVLRETPAPDLLRALTHTVEEVLQRMDRIERLMQTMETRLRVASEPAAGGTGHEHASGVVVSQRIARLADAFPQRSSSSAG